VKTLSALALSWDLGGSTAISATRLSRWAGTTVDNFEPVTISSFSDSKISDSADVATLFNLHYSRLVRSLTVICGNSEEAADAVQEAFVKAHLKWRKISTYDDPVGWIRRVAINKVRDGHRSRVRRERIVDRLATLPKQQRAVAAMFYVEQMSVLEIAAALEISDGAVKFHLHQAREKLRAHIEAARANEESDR
jgi:RNA polymerase sigma-70 factor (ECF subfamily)